MRPGRNGVWTRRRGRRRLLISVAVFVAILIAVGSGVLRHRTANQHHDPLQATSIVYQMRQDPSPWARTENDASRMLADIREKRVAAIGVTLDAILVSTKGGAQYFVSDRFAVFSQSLLLNAIKGADAPDYQIAWLPNVSIGTQAGVGPLLVFLRDSAGMLVYLLMLAMMVWYVRREMKGDATLIAEPPDTSFDDVIGAVEAKAALEDIKAYLRDPQSFTKLGIRPPCGVLMTGSPGVGKTRLAQALAGECGAHFIAITGSFFSAKYYGVGIQKVKYLFKTARKHGPVVIFIDEADGLAARTTGAAGSADAESNRIINQLLAEMDGFEKNEGVILVAATNFPENLDEALRRPGRFDRIVPIRLPDIADRVKIFEYYLGKLPSCSTDIDCKQLARLTVGLSPASLSMIVNQAGLIARKQGAGMVCAEHLREAVKVVRIGDVSGAQKALDTDEVRRVAVHEAGHGIVAALLGAGVLEELTVLPRGGALGMALITKPQDKQLYRRSELEKELMVLLGGRNAELLVFGEASSGAAQDLQEASRISLEMVSRLGFGGEGNLFSLAALPRENAGRQLDNAIEQANALLIEMNERCFDLLTRNESILSNVTRALARTETVPGTYVYELISKSGVTQPPELEAAYFSAAASESRSTRMSTTLSAANRSACARDGVFHTPHSR
ncbi:ATP-dependent metalloprotease [Caballeronia hypogeia]|uniref:ATP-dependent metalloprotease n=1 Tax=Caballeronia hypogeia TaxID=1777140 RepID=A0A158A803_9BURK|nr:AAA family ATPase [Caballeronia hypogeia]SAK53913.1 ATP-dependent metalloprotease [Caballeronia hypogeia]